MKDDDTIIILTPPPRPSSNVALLESTGDGKVSNAHWFNSKEEAIAYLQSME
jgi:hypothetical protein